MKTQTITWKWINLVLILALLGIYQLVSSGRAQAEERARLENQIQVLTVEKEDAQALAAMQAEAGQAQTQAGSQEADAGQYRDGTFKGTGEGFGGPVTAQVVIENGRISQIEILEAEFEDSAYLNTAMSMIPHMIEEQKADVDTASGATMSSLGIRGAVEAALKAGE